MSATGRHRPDSDGSPVMRPELPPHADRIVRGDKPGWRVGQLARFPRRMLREEFYAAAYPLMFLARRLDERLLELFQKGYAKGTVTTGFGNEATAIGMALPLRPGRDVVSLLHRDTGSHLLLGASPYQIFCQFMANADSPTHAREGNAHYGDAASRRLPMISHLGKMLSLVVGGTWAARRQGESVFGLAVMGDGGVEHRRVSRVVEPGLRPEGAGPLPGRKQRLLIFHAHRVPVSLCAAFGSCGWLRRGRVDDRRRRCLGGVHLGLRCPGDHAGDVVAGHSRVHDGPAVRPRRLRQGRIHAGRADARVAGPRSRAGREAETLRRLRHVRGERCGDRARDRRGVACSAGPGDAGQGPDPERSGMRVFADGAPIGLAAAGTATRTAGEPAGTRPAPGSGASLLPSPDGPPPLPPYRAAKVKNGEAVTRALDYVLEHNPRAFLFGLDVGTYGSAFKTCKGLIERHGADRVLDMPLCESALVGFALGASQVGERPILEFQFADFSTEVGSQLGMNASTWYFRTGNPHRCSSGCRAAAG